MLSASELKELLKTIPSGFKAPDDEFFTAANEALLPKYKKLGVITDISTEDEEQLQPGAAQPNAEAASKQIFCNVAGCKEIFDSVANYQTHFNSIHRFLCAECKRSLPTAHLLDLHISELHDSYFAARAERGEPMYACFLEECKLKLVTPAARKEHCISAHKFPSNFRFDQLSGKAAGGKKGKGKAHTKVLKDKGTSSLAAPSGEELMETAEHVAVAQKPKAICFGHQREKTFNTQNKTHRQHGSSTAAATEQPLEDLHALQNALEDIM